MNPSLDDPDDLVRKKIDFNDITKMSYQMHVPDSITVGPSRTTMPHFNTDMDRLPVRMEVPDTIRLDNHARTNMSNGNHYPNHSSDTTLPTIDDDDDDDDDYTAVPTQQHHPIQDADLSHVEPHFELNDKQVSVKLQSLQKRVHDIERTLVARNSRDRIVYTCVIGYFLLQALLSVRRSMLN